MIQARAKSAGPLGAVALVAACSSHSAGRVETLDASADAEGRLSGDGSISADAVGDTLAGCATSAETATPAVDVYFIIDSSGSMNDLLAPQQSKWSAIVSALTAFVNDPASSGLGAGIQYFPTPLSGVPASCSSDQDCGKGGPCLLGVCNDGNQDACATGADCPAGTTCVPVSTCANDPNTLCVAFGAPCGADPNGFDLGACGTALTTSYCSNGDSCTAADYAQAAVPIASLPTPANAIVTSLQNRRPSGSTPTQPALQGAINAAETYASAHPGRTVVTVLATDSAPDEAADTSTGVCTQVDPTEAATQIAQIAAAGLQGTPSIETFAIGVFTPNDVAAGTATLNQIAMSGGSGSPFIIDTASTNGSASVAQQFLDALAQIRAASGPCQFSLPAQNGNFDQVNVNTTSAAGALSTVAYVESASACNANTGGWYYDVDPADGGTPTAIDVCPATCAELKSDPSGVVTIVLGCQTLTR